MSYVTIVGNVGKDPEVKTVNVDGEERQLVEFSVAENRYGSDEPTWYPITVWEGSSSFNFIKDHVKRGSGVKISASHYEESYTDKEGNERRANRYRLFDIQFVGGKKKDGGDEADDKSTGEAW